MQQALIEERRAFGFETLQVEYTQLAGYCGDILVEHDVTFDLFSQIARRERTLSAAWDLFRWRRFETRALRRFPGVVVMSEKDAEMVGRPAVVIPNGVDLERFRAVEETPGERLLFIGISRLTRPRSSSRTARSAAVEVSRAHRLASVTWSIPG